MPRRPGGMGRGTARGWDWKDPLPPGRRGWEDAAAGSRSSSVSTGPPWPEAPAGARALGRSEICAFGEAGFLRCHQGAARPRGQVPGFASWTAKTCFSHKIQNCLWRLRAEHSLRVQTLATWAQGRGWAVRPAPPRSPSGGACVSGGSLVPGPCLGDRCPQALLYPSVGVGTAWAHGRGTSSQDRSLTAQVPITLYVNSHKVPPGTQGREVDWVLVPGDGASGARPQHQPAALASLGGLWPPVLGTGGTGRTSRVLPHRHRLHRDPRPLSAGQRRPQRPGGRGAWPAGPPAGPPARGPGS